MVGMPQLPGQVRLADPQQLLSDRRIHHVPDGTAAASVAHGRRTPNLGIAATDLSLSPAVATAQAELLEREHELATLSHALDAAAAGFGGTVVITGEAGIGKSALVERFVSGLEARVLVGTCDDLSIPRPLAPFRDLAGSVAPALAEAVASGAAGHEIFPLLLEELDGPQPTVLVLEDVHWADGATVDAATFVIRRIGALPALLVLTIRDAEAACEGLDAMLGAAGAAGATFLQLHALSKAAVASLGAPDDVYAATRGNPFLVTELLASDGGLPATVANAVIGRAAHLGEQARELVELVSVVPGRLPSPILDLALPAWAGAAEEPERLRLLEIAPTHVHFRHELARQAILSSLSAVAQRGYHRRILDALLVAGGDPADIVHHGEAAGAEDAVAAHVLRAARRAAQLESRREAYAHFRRALDFVDGLPQPEQAAVLGEYAAAAYFAGHLDEALDATRRVIEMHREHGDDAEVGRWTRVLARLLWFAGDGKGVHAKAREAVDILEPLGPSIHLGAAYNTMSRHAMLRREIAETELWGARALDMADRFDDEETRVQALVNIASARLLVDPDATQGLRDAHAAAHAAGDREEATRALANLAYTLMSWGRADAALAASRDGVAYAERHEVLHMAPYNILVQAWLQLRAGRWEEAERTARTHEASKVTIHRLLAQTVLAELAVRRGDDDAGERLAELKTQADRTDELQRQVPVFELTIERALLGGKAPRGDLARPYIDLSRAPHADEVIRLGAWAGIAGVDVDLEAPEATPWAPMLRGDWRAAADAFGEAGWAYDRALMLSLASDEESLLEAIGIAQGLGAAPLTRRVTRQLRSQGLRVPRGPRESTRANQAGLTSRQLEVLSLLGAGLTNAEIADRLVVSPRTAEHHVAAVLQKLGAPSRREAARRAVELGVA
jgi:DNA-binding CsgD family transcriptional regulator/tetratricopeptide (TPR) repeat protein